MASIIPESGCDGIFVRISERRAEKTIATGPCGFEGIDRLVAGLILFLAHQAIVLELRRFYRLRTMPRVLDMKSPADCHEFRVIRRSEGPAPAPQPAVEERRIRRYSGRSHRKSRA